MTTNINFTTNIVHSLRSLIDSKSLLYESTNELVDIAEKENLTVLSKHKNSTNNINFVYKKKIRKKYFGELVTWSTENDILKLANQSLLVSVVKMEYKKFA
jgi:hypothetical protein